MIIPQKSPLVNTQAKIKAIFSKKTPPTPQLRNERLDLLLRERGDMVFVDDDMICVPGVTLVVVEDKTQVRRQVDKLNIQEAGNKVDPIGCAIGRYSHILGVNDNNGQLFPREIILELSQCHLGLEAAIQITSQPDEKLVRTKADPLVEAKGQRDVFAFAHDTSPWLETFPSFNIKNNNKMGLLSIPLIAKNY
ncbi:MAG: hypothetical protein AAB797_01210 [Patescibacteria group bacterium]